MNVRRVDGGRIRAWPALAAAVHGRRDAFPWLLAGVVAVAWLSLWLWGASPYARYLGHGERLSGSEGWLALALFLAGWTLMVTAMMLPTAAALLRSFATLVHNRPDGGRLRALVCAGVVSAWLLVGYLFREADAGVHAVVAGVGWLRARPGLVGAGALLLAGVYQFTPLKYRCLVACRSPRGFIYRHWRGRRAASEAFRIGLAYGRSCVGCCWALMLVVFALGTASLAWMLGLGAVMALEKNLPVGRGLGRWAGVALIAAGVAAALNLPHLAASAG